MVKKTSNSKIFKYITIIGLIEIQDKCFTTDAPAKPKSRLRFVPEQMPLPVLLLLFIELNGAGIATLDTFEMGSHQQ